MFLTSRISFRKAAFAGAALVVVSVFASANVWAQVGPGGPVVERGHIDEVLKELNRGRSVGQVAVAPDGKHLAWILGGREGGEIVVAPLDDVKKTQRVSAATKPDQHCRESGIAWKPDSKALAFFSDCAKPGGQADLYLGVLDSSPARRLTELNGFVNAPAFSPDGKKVGFLYVEGATRPAGALAAMKPSSGVIGEDGLEIQRVAVAAVDAAAPVAPTVVNPANLHAYEFDWSPDSKALAYVAANPPGENNWWVAKLYTQSMGGEAKAILAPAEVAGALHGLQIAVPRWSPDGKAVAFIGGLMSDQGSTGGDVWIVSATGGEPRDLTKGRPTSAAWEEWDGNEHLFVSELAGGNDQLIRFRLEGDRTGEGNISFGSPIFSIPGSVGDGRMSHSLSATSDHSLFVFEASTFDHPAEIYGAKPGTVMTSGLDGVMQLSHFNDDVQPGWGKSVSLSWKSDTFRVQGWLLLPKEYDPAKKYPLIVEAHGGPAAAVESHWGERGGLSATAFSALGYFVLLP